MTCVDLHVVGEISIKLERPIAQIAREFLILNDVEFHVSLDVFSRAIRSLTNIAFVRPRHFNVMKLFHMHRVSFHVIHTDLAVLFPMDFHVLVQ